jgi:hypothetical protein
VPSAAADGRLGLLVPNGSRFHRDQLLDRGNLTLMEGAATAVFGRPVRLSLEFGLESSDGAASAGDVGGIRAAAPADPDGRPEADPMVRKVLEVFDGDIRSVRRKE